MFWRSLPTRAFFFWFLLVVWLGVAFYLVLGLGATRTLTQQLLRRQQALARAEASNLTSFFQVFGESVAVLSRLKTVTSPNSAIWEMDAFVEQWRDSGLIRGVVLTDRNGVVRFNSNVLGTHDVGASLADRDYFVWAKNKGGAGEYFVSEPVVSRLGASKGQVIVIVASPVYQNGLFVGVVAASVELSPLTQRYLGLMKISEDTDAFLIDQSGKLLYSSSDPEAVGSSLFELLPELKDKIKTTGEGKLQTERRLVAYSPIALGNQNWLVIMASPVQDIKNLTTPIYIRIAVMLLLVSLAAPLFGVIIGRDIKFKKKLKKEQSSQPSE